MELGFQTLSRALSTFDMDQFGKICRNHWKKRLKISKLVKLESGKVILLRTENLHNTNLPPIIQRPVNFCKFAEPYLPTLKTYQPKTWQVDKFYGALSGGVDGFPKLLHVNHGSQRSPMQLH